uniref:interleukin-10 receptor subunit beta n=1 Tax=Euleptes europaea TaxID=460621 RepID=UPI0025400033|nr:interleukin-10 receptor subunit beta [Euleptes europaea]
MAKGGSGGGGGELSAARQGGAGEPRQDAPPRGRPGRLAGRGGAQGDSPPPRAGRWPGAAGCLAASPGQYIMFVFTVHGIVPEPQNVRVHSVTFNSTLQWDPIAFHKANMTYTVQYQKHSGEFVNLCTRIAFTECTMSSIPLLGNYTVRVRTESEKEQSNWKSITFTPIDTVIGPPEVHVESRPRALYVEVRGPFFQQSGTSWPIQHFYGNMVYSMLVWKKGYDEQVKVVNIKYDSEKLSDLDPWTTYCIHVRALIPESNKTGQWSKMSCVATTDNGISSMLLTVGLLSGLIGFFLCCWMFLRVYQQVKYIFHPSYSLPQHFKEFLSKPFYSSQSLASQGEDYCYEKITVVSEISKNGTDESEEELNKAKQQLQNSKEISEAKKVSDCPLLHTVHTEWCNAPHSEGILQSFS